MTERPTSHRSREPVEVVDYDPAWPAEFERLAARAAATLGELAAGVEHVGSTAVPGLAAKPIVDLYVLVATRDDVPAAIERLGELGYRHERDLGFPGREAFAWPPGESRHHLYLATPETETFRRSVVLRDRLRADHEAAAAYGALKRELARRHRDDRVAYGEGKSEFIERLLGA